MYLHHDVQNDYGRLRFACQEGCESNLARELLPNGWVRTRATVEAQLLAMNSVLYEVGLFRPAGGDHQAGMFLRTWDRQTVLESLPWLHGRIARAATFLYRRGRTSS